MEETTSNTKIYLEYLQYGRRYGNSNFQAATIIRILRMLTRLGTRFSLDNSLCVSPGQGITKMFGNDTVQPARRHC